MGAVSGFLAMGGYAGFVWPAFGLAAVVMAGLVLVSLRELHAREAEVAALESAPPPARRTEPEEPTR